MKLALMAGILAATAAAQTQTQTAPGGSIEGTAVNAATGAPLKKVSVRLVGVGARQDPRGTARMPQQLAKETDDQGHFSFAGLEAGRYSLSAQRQGFLRASYGARHLSGNGVPIPVAADQHIKDVVLKLSPQSVIVGKVLDEDGDPVANAQVRVYKMAYRNGHKQWVQGASTGTSDIGEYRIPNLEPGRYLVGTSVHNNQNTIMTPGPEPLPNKAEMVAAATYYPNASDPSGAAPVDVGPGAEVRGIDVRIRKVPAYRVRGKVVLQVGAPDRGTVVVMLSPKDTNGQVLSTAVARPPENAFEIRGVPAGSYILHARVGGGQQGQIAYQAIDIGNNHLDGVVLTVSKGMDIAGTMKIAESDAQVDLSRVNVNVRPVGFVFGGNGRAQPGADRGFVLKNVLPVRFMVNVYGLPDNCFVQSIKYGGQEVTDAGVEPTGNTPLEVTLSATAGMVSGVVGDKDGKPVPAATVVLLPKSKGDALSYFTDETGSFTFKGLKPGDYRLFAWEDVEQGAWMDPDFLKPFESQAADVKIDPSGKQAVQVRAIPGQ